METRRAKTGAVYISLPVLRWDKARSLWQLSSSPKLLVLVIAMPLKFCRPLSSACKFKYNHTACDVLNLSATIREVMTAIVMAYFGRYASPLSHFQFYSLLCIPQALTTLVARPRVPCFHHTLVSDLDQKDMPDDPYRWDNRRGWRSVRPLQPGRGMYHDVRRRLPYYWSDITDAFNYRSVAATVRIYFIKYTTSMLFPSSPSPANSVLR